ncbi:MAG: TIGR04283 family arsenosugar biosynthesis glycosyltransferase [Burkholderiaceae bacterium]
MKQRISLIVPVLNEAEGIAATLGELAALRAEGAELIVVDGGSSDATLNRCQGQADRILIAPRGRARQMNRGAAGAAGSVLLFVHADTRLPPGAGALVLQALESGRHDWGRFDVVIEGRSKLFPLIAALMNWRSRMSGIATGDQAIFVRRKVFDALGGFADQPLMEDIELCKSLRRRGPPACIRQRVVTSGRRWERCGVWRTIFLMWRLRFLYWLGVSPQQLAKAYR